MINSIVAEKAFDKVQHSFMKRTLNQVGQKVTSSPRNMASTKISLVKLYWILNVKILNVFFLGSGIRQGCLLLLLLFNFVLQVVTRKTRPKNEIKAYELERKK